MLRLSKKEMVIGDGIKKYNGMDNGDCGLAIGLVIIERNNNPLKQSQI